MKRTPKHLAYQIESHALILQRWFAPDEALRRARAAVKAGRCWWWPEPVQGELFR